MPFKSRAKQLAYFRRYNKARAKEQTLNSARWREANRARWDSNQRNYRERNRVRLRDNARQRRKSDPIGVLAVNRKSYLKHRPKRLAEKLRHYSDNREKYKRWKEAHYAKNRASIIKRNSDYAKSNPHVGILRSARRRIRLLTVENPGAIVAFVAKIRARPTFCCYYCRKICSVKRLHFDHVVALSRGGKHSVDNLCASCSTCNLKKHASPVSSLSFIEQRLLAL